MNRIVGIGEYVISNAPEDFIKTFALSSCVAVTFYNPSIHLAAMVHIALPTTTDLEGRSDDQDIMLLRVSQS